MRLLVGWLALGVAVTALGCTSQPAAPEKPAYKIPPEQIKIQVGDEQVLAQLVAAHKGQPVFVDYWATWCHPCVEFFPHTVQIADRYQPQGLAVIAVTFDQADQQRAVREFLGRQGAGFENLICSYEAGPEAFEKFAVDQVPCFRLYDREGKLVKQWDSAPEHAEAETEIEKLLTAKE